MFGFFSNTKLPVKGTNHSHEKIPGIDRTYMADIVGPGYWSALHKIGAQATNDEGKKFFMDYIKFIRTHFPCSDCKNHINEYVNANPIEPYLKDADGCFNWTWKFHNTVNRRLKKREVPFEEAVKIYKKDEGVCSLNCAGNNNNNNQIKQPQSQRQIINNNTNNNLFKNDFNEELTKSNNFDKALGYVVKHNFRHNM